ncbi:hypothetical protein F444_22619 [Phytophthora nicotianae P1976]|uniref:PiggyBac transposable element-derived protein domain-containing protein n=1 Tax=Phytophthora nicotianae P1976 TaxID=1317066 RepID=A0A080YX92_PHYNI|nr:hypothetical protein F444_22619 [Phytophthora nicotianae P1976]
MPPSVTPADPKPQRPMPDAPTPPLVEPAGLTPPLNDSAIPPAPSMAPPVPVRHPTGVEAKTSKRMPRRAGKATPQVVLQPLNQPSVRTSASAASSIGRPAATARRSSATSRSSAKKRRTAQVIPDSTAGVPEMTDQHIPDQAATTEETEDAVPDGPDSVMGNTERAVTKARNILVSARSVLDHDRGNGVSLDDFDSDNFLEALRRNRIFEGNDPDDLNVGVDDWLLALDSDAEGDEESILLDEDNSEDEDESEADVSGTVSNDESVEDFAGVDDDVPVEFDLAEADLKRLQAEEWDALMEDDSGRLHLDHASRYDGPYGPTRAAMAYATSPLAMFYFFLPKELWRKIAEETNRYRLESIHEIGEGMRERAVQKRQTVPSTIVYTVDEYKAKLRRKCPILPHEIVRFIGLLIARTLEPRRESLSRHWITKWKELSHVARSGNSLAVIASTTSRSTCISTTMLDNQRVPIVLSKFGRFFKQFRRLSSEAIAVALASHLTKEWFQCGIGATPCANTCQRSQTSGEQNSTRPAVPKPLIVQGP